jgi:hypothetical protein
MVSFEKGCGDAHEMEWTKVKKSSLRSAYSGNDDAVLSRREALAGLGFAGVFAVAGSTLLALSPAEARINTPTTEPDAAPADAAKAEVAECSDPERNLADFDTAEFTEFSAQRWRRVRRRYWRRRYWRRPYWRRRYWRRWRVVCRRRWIRGRLVRVCRRVWW